MAPRRVCELYSPDEVAGMPSTPSRLSYLTRWWLTALLCCASWNVFAEGSAGPWILVDSKKQTLSVIQDGEVQVRFYGIAIGRGGVGPLRTRGDAKTPVGEFRVAWINPDSQYTLFFGLDFPNLDYATRALEQSVIDENEFIAIKRALREQRTPPQDTRLGGNIGIHGVGSQGDARIHDGFNWTDGCVALTDQQIQVLAQWVRLGTKVIIN